MITQKLFKNGNSVVVTIPNEYLKTLDLRDGSQVVVEQDEEAQSITIYSKRRVNAKTSLTPHFLEWLDSFNKQYAPALKELAKR